MRLLNTSTLKLRWLPEDEPTPPYAALSHCWGADEVVYDDLQSSSDWKQKYGFRKLIGACREAFGNHKLDWLWADTVCIDRSSSAELSESINSMYRWYRNCSICLAYLDNKCTSGPPELLLVNSRWMWRSWTLTELIAPRDLGFYNADWSLLGTKKSLVSTLSRITQIDQTVLEDAENLSDISIGKRMSWAAQRSALKVEDIAYSLLGIFGVSMEIRYGEGSRAFMRLQEELLGTLNDASLFAWKATDTQEYHASSGRKRIKADDFLEYMPIESRDLPGENDTVIVDAPRSRSFACPFYVRDKEHHLRCLTRADLRTIRDLKKHLWTAHRQPYYCPTCGTTFGRASARDEHIKTRTCSLQQWKGAPQGLSEGQLQQLAAKRCESSTSEVDQWYGIWHLIYPRTDRTDMPSPPNAPRTPYLAGNLEFAVCVVRSYWAKEGKQVIADFLEQRNLRDYDVPDEERNLSALYQLTLDNLVDQVVQTLKDEDSHVEPSNTLSNVLSSLRMFCSKLM
ncbi:Vegetative incompatibility protein HET-E-1 [Apiospora phragmitis]|uniref:Vegetative incompatibility protein HET-E-1 n=1 Tax=Apiospora phragmitis TaxID=2905665 RepID=A0ABR1VPK9_9PEZI